ncbi:MAG TPA: dTDP-4-amino-4,6-dideoxygalactose transaminase [Bacteroidota bacterium]|nr:dTDP-4-amino-4,6-dideoxygalactose transaminase [Bacteroidota bacterium]
MDKSIPFNRLHLTGKEIEYCRQAINTGKISGNGLFTQLAQSALCRRYGYNKALLATSCTDALEMCALLARIEPGDEIIMPSYTFVSTANAFVLRGATIRFVDSLTTHPNLDHNAVESLITSRTKAIIAVHYAGVACEMDELLSIADKHGLLLIEDAAQAIDSFYKRRPLGGIGHLAAFSFHETKNIISGEGGLLVVNDSRFFERSEILWEKGTNRTAFYRGEVDKYGWVDVGSSFLPSEIMASFLYAQVEEIDEIQNRRIQLWERYFEGLNGLALDGCLSLPHIPATATNNGHMFYLLCKSMDERSQLIEFLRQRGVQAVFHYLPLHKSRFYEDRHDGRDLPMSVHYAECLLRLPLYYDLEEHEQDAVIAAVQQFYH